ncbi:MAG: peptidylprolyl isomerase [Eubacterium sp.]|nr:peptidylprolyl isomerase [Eubacterium sp.]
MSNPKVTIETEYCGNIVLELYPEIAPNTVNNFLSLVKKGFYDGLVFHRVIKGFMIQGGCPEGNGTGGPGYNIKGEFSGNGFKNDLKHSRGVISMARAMHPDSAGSQFFIMHKDAPHLDGQYAAFGKVIEGMETVDEIAECVTDFRDRPMMEMKMVKVTADTDGAEYPEPEKM